VAKKEIVEIVCDRCKECRQYDKEDKHFDGAMLLHWGEHQLCFRTEADHRKYNYMTLCHVCDDDLRKFLNLE
jgi:hypothetical protein